jgi:opacity protein-like surface antigen
MRIPLIATLLAVAATGAAGSAHAADNGLYIGGSIGQANTQAELGTLPEFDEDDTGFKVFVGIRPLDLLAFELAYVDFGGPSRSIGPVRTDAEVKGAAAFGLLYLPLPLPIVDVYGKAGFARLDTRIDAGSFRLDESGTDFAWGLGAQLNFGSLAIRAEYERFQTDSGDPDLISLGVSWTFL